MYFGVSPCVFDVFSLEICVFTCVYEDLSLDFWVPYFSGPRTSWEPTLGVVFVSLAQVSRGQDIDRDPRDLIGHVVSVPGW